MHQAPPSLPAAALSFHDSTSQLNRSHFYHDCNGRLHVLMLAPTLRLGRNPYGKPEAWIGVSCCRSPKQWWQSY
jgi:hypothetical protein